VARAAATQRAHPQGADLRSDHVAARASGRPPQEGLPLRLGTGLSVRAVRAASTADGAVAISGVIGPAPTDRDTEDASHLGGVPAQTTASRVVSASATWQPTLCGPLSSGFGLVSLGRLSTGMRPRAYGPHKYGESPVGSCGVGVGGWPRRDVC
jgi:hypothetical protein